MGRRGEVLVEDGPAAFAFLVDVFGFEGPDTEASRVGLGKSLVWRRGSLTVEVGTWAWKNEAGFDTTVRFAADATLPATSAGLGELYVACGLGPSQDVPGTTGGGHTVRKRVAQHARALRAVMPHLIAPTGRDLVRGCHPRPRPKA